MRVSNRRAIEWCQRVITPRYPNFHFRFSDIHNSFYNPRGRFRDFEYRFPYADESFDFVILSSVFTHMLSKGVAHYVSEVSRVLASGGRCFSTWFLLNPESVTRMEKKQATVIRNAVDREWRKQFGGMAPAPPRTWWRDPDWMPADIRRKVPPRD